MLPYRTAEVGGMPALMQLPCTDLRAVRKRRLLEEMTDQHVKESLLAYIVLLTSATGDPRASLPAPLQAPHGFSAGCGDTPTTYAASPAGLKGAQH